MNTRHSEVIRQRWQDPEYRKKMSKIRRNLWKDPEYRKMQSQNKETHGLERHPLYKVWRSMNSRCGKRYHFARNYYDRGIRICKRWQWQNGPTNFVNWALANGWKPGLQINRIDNDGDYTPRNCNFVTPSENAKNRRITERWREAMRPIWDTNGRQKRA